MQDKKPRVNFNFDKIFDNQNIISLIESLGIAEATFLQAKILPEILNGKDYLVKGDSLTGKTLMCGLLLASKKEIANEENKFSAAVIVQDEALERLKDEFSKLNLFEENENFNLVVKPFSEAKECNCENACQKDLLIIDSVEENEESQSVISNIIQKIKGANEKAQIILCAREISNELEKIFKDLCFSSSFSAEAGNKEEVSQTKHYFCMLGSELMAKPNALCDVIEAQGRPATLIFCNQPSDTDMVEAVLNKNGISTAKLIGNAYYSRVMSALNDLERKEISAIIVTDIGAKQINVRNFELVINYSSPDTYETYKKRMGGTNEGGYLRSVISFINPLDLSVFHQIRKGLDFEISSMELPSKEEVCNAKFSNLINSLSANNEYLTDEKTNIYYDLLNQLSDKENVIKALIYNLFVKVKESQQGRKRQDRKERSERTSIYALQDSKSNSYEEGENAGQNKYSHSSSENQVKDIRYYIGLGESDDFTQDELNNLLSKYASEYQDKLKRFNSRKFYSFADFSDDVSDSIQDLMKDAEFNGKAVCFKKASIINVPKEEDDDEDNDETLAQENAMISSYDDESDIDSDNLSEE